MDTLRGGGTLLVPLSTVNANMVITCRLMVLAWTMTGILVRILSHYFCRLGLQSVMGIGRHQSMTIQETAKTTAMIPLSRNAGKPSNAQMKADDP